MQRFPKYNFDSIREQGDLWFLNNESQENQLKYREMLKSIESESHENKNKAILNYMNSTMLYEVPLNLRRRCLRIKEMLRGYRKKFKKIAVVAHYNTINYTISEEFDHKNEPANPAEVKNCEVRGANLEQLFKYN